MSSVASSGLGRRRAGEAVTDSVRGARQSLPAVADVTQLTPAAAAGVSRSELSEDFRQDLDVRGGFYKIRTSANEG